MLRNNVAFFLFQDVISTKGMPRYTSYKTSLLARKLFPLPYIYLNDKISTVVSSDKLVLSTYACDIKRIASVGEEKVVFNFYFYSTIHFTYTIL